MPADTSDTDITHYMGGRNDAFKPFAGTCINIQNTHIYILLVACAKHINRVHILVARVFSEEKRGLLKTLRDRGHYDLTATHQPHAKLCSRTQNAKKRRQTHTHKHSEATPRCSFALFMSRLCAGKCCGWLLCPIRSSN